MASKKESNVTAPKDETQNDPKPTAAPPTPPAPEVEETKTEPEVHASKLKTVQVVTSEVLAGNWGPTFAAAQQKLDEAGYDVDEVWAEFQRRKSAGAPSAF